MLRLLLYTDTTDTEVPRKLLRESVYNNGGYYIHAQLYPWRYV